MSGAHIVASGDTLSGIAAQYDLKLDDIHLIKMGQVLVIPSQGVAR